MTLDQNSQIFGFFLEPIAMVEQDTTRRWWVMRESDQILRRFGECEVRLMAPGHKEYARLRPVADEVWCILQGTVDLTIEDQRADSPTSGLRKELTITAPSRVLIPFGVEFSWSNHAEEALLIRMNTHAWSGETGDLPAEDM